MSRRPTPGRMGVRPDVRSVYARWHTDLSCRQGPINHHSALACTGSCSRAGHGNRNLATRVPFAGAGASGPSPPGLTANRISRRPDLICSLDSVTGDTIESEQVGGLVPDGQAGRNRRPGVIADVACDERALVVQPATLRFRSRLRPRRSCDQNAADVGRRKERCMLGSKPRHSQNSCVNRMDCLVGSRWHRSEPRSISVPA